MGAKVRDRGVLRGGRRYRRGRLTKDAKLLKGIKEVQSGRVVFTIKEENSIKKYLHHKIENSLQFIVNASLAKVAPAFNV